MDLFNTSIVSVVLEELLKSKELSDEEFDYLKEEFHVLCQHLEVYKIKDVDTTKKCNLVIEDIMNQKLSWEKAKINETDEIRSLNKLEDTKSSVIGEIESSEQQEIISKYELSEIERIHKELCNELVNLRNANEEIVNPIFTRLKEQISEFQLSITNAEEILLKENECKKSLSSSIEDLEKLLSEKTDVLDSKIESLSSADNEPSRVTRQIDSINKALHSLIMEQNIMIRKKESLDKEILHQRNSQTELDKLKKTLTGKLDVNRKTLQFREQDVASVTSLLEASKSKVHDLALRKVELNSQKKEVENELRHKLDEYTISKKDYENMKRFLKKKRIILNGAKESLPKLEEQNKESIANIKIMESDLDTVREILVKLKENTDASIAKLLSKEAYSVEKKALFDNVLVESDQHERQLNDIINEGRKRRKVVSVLTAQRDVKSRENSRILSKEFEAKQHVKVKELSILDLTKRCNELSNRLKEFSALFEVVKNERNKYVNLIQNSTQALAEMKEKIRILTDEIEILSSESSAKDLALSKEKATHIQVQRQRDTLRQDMNRLLAEYRVKQSSVEQQIQEVDKMNLSVSKLEKEMIAIKSRYERSVEERNISGIQLIDRNDELCILYERANRQQSTYRSGEQNLLKKTDELRIIRLQLEGLKRQYLLAQSRLPDIENLRIEMCRLKKELQEERVKTSKVSSDLEDPHNLSRWRPLDGEDFDSNQLRAKVSLLQGKIDHKREKILEQELFLSDITRMSDNIREQAKSQQESSKLLGDQFNKLQSKIRDVHKKVLATVSELSMYQATALRLQQEKIIREKDFNDSKWKYENGEIPSTNAQTDLDVMIERYKKQSQSSKQPEFDAKNTSFKTSAEPRPSAYIPDDIGIPKPYGNLAPFKPTNVASTLKKLSVAKSSSIMI